MHLSHAGPHEPIARLIIAFDVNCLRQNCELQMPNVCVCAYGGYVRVCVCKMNRKKVKNNRKFDIFIT